MKMVNHTKKQRQQLRSLQIWGNHENDQEAQNENKMSKPPAKVKKPTKSPKILMNYCFLAFHFFSVLGFLPIFMFDLLVLAVFPINRASYTFP